MPKIILKVSETQKELWVSAAHDERVTLSEWIRRRCDRALLPAERPQVIHVTQAELDAGKVVPPPAESAQAAADAMQALVASSPFRKEKRK